MPARSALFVPGDRPERFSKAIASGADHVIIDLEDAVEEAHKSLALRHLADFASDNPQHPILVRINAAGHRQHDADLQVCQQCDTVAGILLPKAESTEQLAWAARAGKPLWPIIESARGLVTLPALAAASGVERLCLGSVDLALDLDLGTGEAADMIIDQARYALLLHARANTLAAPVDGVYVALDDAPGLAAAARRSRAMGFAGMLCLHPRQVAVIHDAWRPQPDALAWARRVVEAATLQGTGAFRLEGQMIDAPVLARARRLLELSGA